MWAHLRSPPGDEKSYTVGMSKASLTFMGIFVTSLYLPPLASFAVSIYITIVTLIALVQSFRYTLGYSCLVVILSEP